MDVLNGASLLIMGGIPDPLSVNRIQAKSGPLKVGSATSGHSLTATDDLLIAGKLEVDGLAYFDSAPTIGSYTLPTADGAADQVLRTNGLGTASWATVSGTAATQKIQDTDADTWVHTESIANENIIRFKTAGVERAVILANGKVGIGTAAPEAPLHIIGDLLTESDGGVLQYLRAYKYSSAQAYSRAGILLQRSRGTKAAPAAVVDGDSIWSIEGQTHDGTGWLYPGGIRQVITGTVATNTIPNSLIFETTAGSSGVERMRIDPSGKVGIGTETPGSKLEIALATANLEVADAGSVGATAQAWVEVQVGNVTGYLRVYAAK